MPDGSPAPSAAPPAPTPPRGPPPEQIARTVAWATERLRAFYQENPPEMPPRFGRREFGFIPAPRPPPDRTPFFRHMGMRSREDLHQFLVRNAPWHAYYSTAYYQDPGQSTMKEKGWLGADLIFDLDADHLPNADALTFEQQLDEVKRQAVKLLEEYILGDFGFSTEHVRVVFSGGRGYHIHVSDPRVLPLEANARREVVDHLTMRGFDTSKLVVTHTASAYRGFKGQRVKETYYAIPRPGEDAWRGRYGRAVVSALETLAAMPDPRSVIGWARERGIKGIGEKKAAELLDLSKRKDAAGRSQIDLIRDEGRVSHPLLMEVVQLDGFAVQGLNEDTGETDEPVTADVKRLIRLPGSIHGKTGLRVTPVPIDGFRDFDPLRETPAFGEEPVRVVVSKPEKITLCGTEYACEPGEQELPLRYALFLVLRRRALVA